MNILSKKLLSITMVFSIVTILGCASMPSAQYVSPNKYQNFNCQQLSNEYNRQTQYLNSSHTSSGIRTTGVGIGITGGRHGIYPTISFGVGAGNSSNRNNLSIVLGERDAVIQSGRLKQCDFTANLKLSTEK